MNFFISRHVVFNERIFPFSQSNIKTSQKVYNSKLSIPPIPEQLDVITQVENERVQDDINLEPSARSTSQYTVPRPEPGHEKLSKLEVQVRHHISAPSISQTAVNH